MYLDLFLNFFYKTKTSLIKMDYFFRIYSMVENIIIINIIQYIINQLIQHIIN